MEDLPVASAQPIFYPLGQLRAGPRSSCRWLVVRKLVGELVIEVAREPRCSSHDISPVEVWHVAGAKTASAEARPAASKPAMSTPRKTPKTTATAVMRRPPV